MKTIYCLSKNIGDIYENYRLLIACFDTRKKAERYRMNCIDSMLFNIEEVKFNPMPKVSQYLGIEGQINTYLDELVEPVNIYKVIRNKYKDTIVFNSDSDHYNLKISGSYRVKNTDNLLAIQNMVKEKIDEAIKTKNYKPIKLY